MQEYSSTSPMGCLSEWSASSFGSELMTDTTKGTLLREDEELEEELEDDVEDEEIENLDRVLPPEEMTDEAFEEETDDLDES